MDATSATNLESSSQDVSIVSSNHLGLLKMGKISRISLAHDWNNANAMYFMYSVDITRSSSRMN